jgi:hypothetical protein
MEFEDKNGNNVKCSVQEYIELTQDRKVLIQKVAVKTSKNMDFVEWKSRKKRGRPTTNNHKHWNTHDDELVMQVSTHSTRQLTKLLGRTTGAIHLRRFTLRHKGQVET